MNEGEHRVENSGNNNTNNENEPPLVMCWLTMRLTGLSCCTGDGVLSRTISFIKIGA